MGIFEQLFSGKKKEAEGEVKKKAIPWIPLTNDEQLEQIRLGSATRPQIIYKHSTTCGISSMVLRVMEGALGSSEPEADFYFLDLHRNREISEAVARRFRLRHESPQLLILKNGEVSAAASHGAIAEMDFGEYL